jgi:hypothetical protein
MASSPPQFQAVYDSNALPPRAGIDEIVEECLSLTADALLATQAANKVDISHATAAAREIIAAGRPADLLEQVARIQGVLRVCGLDRRAADLNEQVASVQGIADEQLPGAILTLSEAAASTMLPTPPLIPFAGKLIAPTSFYESFDQIHKLAKRLMCPVIYAEDTDSIGIGSINPIAAQILSEEILNTVDRRIGIRPFVTSVRIDYVSWTFLCRKHFAL